MSTGLKFMYWSYVVCAVLCALTFVILLYITIRVIHLVGKSDKMTIAMLFCLLASLLGKVDQFFNMKCIYIANLGFFWDETVRLHRAEYKGPHQATCADATLTYGGIYFLAIAVMLTINKWIYFNMRLLANIKITKLEE